MSEPKPSLDGLRIERKERAQPGSRAGLVLGAVLGLALLGALAWWLTRAKTVPVRTALVREAAAGGAEHTVLNASGYVTARRAATVSSKVTGKVVEVLIEEGMRVREGQILARLDDTNVKASLALADAQGISAKAALEEIRVRLEEANQELERQAGLLTNRIATQADFDHAQAAARAYQARLRQLDAEVAVAERTVATWRQQMEDLIIRAPFAGVVTSKNAQPGEMISPISAGGGFTRTGICTIVDMESLEIEIDVNESYINRVQPAQPVEGTLDAYPDWRIPCKVIAIIPTADRQKSTVKVRVGFDALDARILPEMSVKVAFRESAGAGPGPARACVVPKESLRQQDGRDMVWVVQNNKAERRAVTVSGGSGQEALVSAGLRAGERVVTEGPAALTDGSPVVEMNR